jgi:uncharacterized protein YegL
MWFGLSFCFHLNFYGGAFHAPDKVIGVMTMPKLEPEFANNLEPRCPCVLLLDTSISMSGSSINELNQGLQIFNNDLQDPTALLRVEAAVVTFDDSPRLVQDIVTASNFQPPTLTAQGGIDMAGGIQKALDLLRSRKEQYKANKVSQAG